MKKFNTKQFSLIDSYTYDWFDGDLINRDIISDDPGKSTVFDLNEEQAKQALCLALRKLNRLRQNLDKVRDLLG